MVAVASDSSPTQRLAENLLGIEDLGKWIAEKRDPAPGLRRAWPWVAHELAEATGCQVTVSGETCRKWWRHWTQLHPDQAPRRLTEERGAA